LLKRAVFVYYGQGKPTAKSSSWLWTPDLWNSRNVRMGLSYDENKKITNWSMGYIPILDEMYADKAAKKKK
jgi:hypothetical protein